METFIYEILKLDGYQLKDENYILNRWGLDGWELCGVLRLNSLNHYYMKKKIK